MLDIILIQNNVGMPYLWNLFDVFDDKLDLKVHQDKGICLFNKSVIICTSCNVCTRITFIDFKSYLSVISFTTKFN